jgi:hypothetical protein
MSQPKKTLRNEHRVSWVIAGNGSEQKFFEKTFPTNEALEWDDVIIEILHNQREQRMIRLLKDYLKKN